MENIICYNCHSINNYSTELKNGQKVATCNYCKKFIKNIPYQLPKFYIGKYKGMFINECNDLDYLIWFVTKTSPKKNISDACYNQINFLLNTLPK